jgi:broad specificity phosphatase PhoE
MADRIFIIRHGQTEWSRADRHTGHTDVALEPEGIREAELVGARLASESFALVLSSPLQRALETCRIAGFGKNVQTRDDLMEWDYGDYEGLSTAQIRERQPMWSLWDDGAPSGETAAQVGSRADRVLQEVRAVEGDAVLFAHAHLLRVLAARWLGLPPRGGCRFALSTSSVSVLGYERDTEVISLWNDISHLVKRWSRAATGTVG